LISFRFRLAADQITFLCQMETEFDVKTSLKDLPDTLTKAYDEIYQGILAQKKNAPQLALNAFRWVKFSYEPLASKTLLDAVSAKANKCGEYSQVGPIETDTILKVCQNLLIWDECMDTFKFAHLSVEEYFDSKCAEGVFTEADCHAYIAETCLSLLCTPENFVKYDLTVDTEEGKYRDRHILLYSATFWAWHFSRYEELCDEDSRLLCGLWEMFLSHSNYRRWLDYHCSVTKTKISTSELFWQKLFTFARLQWRGGPSDPLFPLRDDPSFLRPDDPIFLPCIFGLVRRFKALYELRCDIMYCYVDKLFAYMCQFGYLELVQYLLNKGAEVPKCYYKFDYSPLQLASMNGHDAVVRSLLDHGANPSMADSSQCTPLHLASRSGHELVVRLLLDNGADASAASHDWCTPLHLASKNGCEAVARLLLDRGADSSAADYRGCTPLHLALNSGNEAVARLFLE